VSLTEFSRLNLIMFILKIVLYLYARFVLSLLYSILLVPDLFDL